MGEGISKYILSHPFIEAVGGKVDGVEAMPLEDCAVGAERIGEDACARGSRCRREEPRIPLRRRADARGDWYVVQVPTGKELSMCRVIERVAGAGEPSDSPVASGRRLVPSERPRMGALESPDVLRECFCPSFATQKKVRGEWREVQAILFPGYVIAVSDDVGELERRLRRVEEFTRLLSMGESFVPLEERDRAWISAFTERGERVIPMSMGVMEGDRVVVFQGPLMGREGWIKSVNRRKSLAFIELEMFGRKIETKIGLGIVRKKPCREGSTTQ